MYASTSSSKVVILVFLAVSLDVAVEMLLVELWA